MANNRINIAQVVSVETTIVPGLIVDSYRADIVTGEGVTYSGSARTRSEAVAEAVRQALADKSR